MKQIHKLISEAVQRSTCHTIRIGAAIITFAGQSEVGWNGPPEETVEHVKCLVGGEITPENIGLCRGIHAEIRAISRAARRGLSTNGATLYLSEWFPCAPCAKAIIEAGISRIVLTENISYGKDAVYNFYLAEELLREAGVVIEVRKELSPKG